MARARERNKERVRGREGIGARGKDRERQRERRSMVTTSLSGGRAFFVSPTITFHASLCAVPNPPTYSARPHIDTICSWKISIRFTRWRTVAIEIKGIVHVSRVSLVFRGLSGNLPFTPAPFAPLSSPLLPVTGFTLSASLAPLIPQKKFRAEAGRRVASAYTFLAGKIDGPCRELRPRESLCEPLVRPALLSVRIYFVLAGEVARGGFFFSMRGTGNCAMEVDLLLELRCHCEIL